MQDEMSGCTKGQYMINKGYLERRICNNRDKFLYDIKMSYTYIIAIVTPCVYGHVWERQPWVILQ